QRQRVDEAEELQLDRLVAHGPFHEAVVPPGRAEQDRPAAVEPGEDLLPVRPRQALDLRVLSGAVHETPSLPCSPLPPGVRAFVGAGSARRPGVACRGTEPPPTKPFTPGPSPPRGEGSKRIPRKPTPCAGRLVSCPGVRQSHSVTRTTANHELRPDRQIPG